MDSIRAVGKIPQGTTIIDVMDRGADASEIMQFSQEHGHQFIIRAQHNRLINDAEFTHLFDYVRAQPIMGQHVLTLQANTLRQKRDAQLALRVGAVTLRSPKNKPKIKPTRCNFVYIKEVNLSPKIEPLEWLLFTSLPIDTFAKAITIMKYYTYRWIIEEYHKCLKTGYRIEKTQLKALDRIEALLGFVAVASVKLLQLRDIVRQTPDADALKFVEQEDIDIACAYYEIKEPKMTIDRFLRLIAQLGGFLNRKSDGKPGWQTLWEGWKFFLTLKEGVHLAQKRMTYG
jgi:hypothetical protein